MTCCMDVGLEVTLCRVQSSPEAVAGCLGCVGEAWVFFVHVIFMFMLEKGLRGAEI